MLFCAFAMPADVSSLKGSSVLQTPVCCWLWILNGAEAVRTISGNKRQELRAFNFSVNISGVQKLHYDHNVMNCRMTYLLAFSALYSCALLVNGCAPGFYKTKKGCVGTKTNLSLHMENSHFYGIYPCLLIFVFRN